ncbi:MAG TPA: helix-turn-helix domain-containing protein [Gemmatimonadota bacterium]|nr:helix-turn-helix domain-containing protein [Gemmatimonadota bacterium]
MGSVSVAEAAERLGVSVARVHQRIAEGSLRAERIGAQWVVDELSLVRAAERRAPGRPLSARSAWALIAAAERDDEALAKLESYARSRARDRLQALLALGAGASDSEAEVRRIASALRSRFRNRAARELRRAASADLPRLREDARWKLVVRASASGIASPDVEGYLAAPDVGPLSEEFLLMPTDRDANVILHVLPDGQKAYPDSKLRLAADLAEHWGPREERRAAELLREVAEEHEAPGR